MQPNSSWFRSFRDPENFAVEFQGRWFRVASSESALAMRRLSGVSTSDSTLKKFLSIAPANPAESEAILTLAQTQTVRNFDPNDAEVFSVENLEFETYPWEWTAVQMKAAALLILQLRQELLADKLDLKDASAFNVSFEGQYPFLLDLGSVTSWDNAPAWRAAGQFVKHFLNPLLIASSTQLSASEVWSLGRPDGMSTVVTRSLLPRRVKLRPQNFLFQQLAVPPKKAAPSDRRKNWVIDEVLTLKNSQKFTRRLFDAIGAIRLETPTSTWGSYSTREHYAADDIQRKLNFVTDFVAQTNSGQSWFVDVGGNDGLAAMQMVLGSDCRVIILDSDRGALEVAARSLETKPDDVRRRVHIVAANIVDLQDSSGLGGFQFRPIHKRVQPAGVTCHAVLHHLVITQGVPMALAVHELARFGCAVQIEFVLENDEKVKILKSQIDRWQGEYSIEILIRELEKRFKIVNVLGKTSSTRVMVNALHPRTP